MPQTLPAIYLPHGGGPWPFVDMPFNDSMRGLREYLVNLRSGLAVRPKAQLVVSAHWEESVPTVQSSPSPPMLYDYSGFPQESYDIQWPAPGAPHLAERVRTLFSQVGIESSESKTRGYDHGTFVVTKLMEPSAETPTFQLSLTRDLDPVRLFEIGRALAPLREQGVLILGSGSSYHNMGQFMRAYRGHAQPREDSLRFHDWLAETVEAEPSARQQRLSEWRRAPRARACHPREEHLLPLMVCAGAAAEGAGSVPFRESVLGVDMLAASFS